MLQPSSSRDVRVVGLFLGTLAILATGCAAGAPGTATSSPAPTPSGQGSAAPAGQHSSGHPSPKAAEKSSSPVRALSVRVADGRVSERSGSSEIPLGEKLRLRVECDTGDEVHVHGYDASAPCAPGQAAAITFTADIPGVFEVELEESGLALLELTVR